MVMTGIGDDSYDGTNGYRGFMQYLVAQQNGDVAGNGFEISTNGSDPSSTPHSTTVIANATMIGGGVKGSLQGPDSDTGARFREGSNYRLFNNIITGFGKSGFDVEGSQTAANADARLAGDTSATALRFEHNIVWANADPTGGDANFADASGDGYDQSQNKTFFEDSRFANMLVDPGLPSSAFDEGSMDSPPNVIPASMPTGYTAYDVSLLSGTNGMVPPTDGRALEQTDYAGAVAPGTALTDAWYTGWTVWAADGSDSRPNADGE